MIHGSPHFSCQGIVASQWPTSENEGGYRYERFHVFGGLADEVLHVRGVLGVLSGAVLTLQAAAKFDHLLESDVQRERVDLYFQYE